MMGSKSALSGPRLDSSVWLSFLLFVWFSSSIASTLINKVLMMHFPYPVSISAVHMLSSVIVDWFIIVSRGLSLRPFRQDVFWQCLPVAATINFGKTLTYVSYGMVPASLTHTAKVSGSTAQTHTATHSIRPTRGTAFCHTAASVWCPSFVCVDAAVWPCVWWCVMCVQASSPVFSVLLTKLMYDKWPSGTTSAHNHSTPHAHRYAHAQLRVHPFPFQPAPLTPHSPPMCCAPLVASRWCR